MKSFEIYLAYYFFYNIDRFICYCDIVIIDLDFEGYEILNVYMESSKFQLNENFPLIPFSQRLVISRSIFNRSLIKFRFLNQDY